LDSQLSHGTS
jgi:hypothetical protein